MKNARERLCTTEKINTSFKTRSKKVIIHDYNRSFFIRHFRRCVYSAVME